MRQFTSRYILAAVAMGLLQGITASKPSMIPTEGELRIREGQELKIACYIGGQIQFSTQMNMAHVNQSEFHISFNNESGWYTFTRPNTAKEDTGWYACAEEGIHIQNDEQTIDHPETNISWIYVYVNSSRYFAINTNEWPSIPIVEGRKVIVPCRPTSPDLPVILEIGNGSIAVPENTTYDPKIGFIISEHFSRRQEYSLNVGTCRIDRSKLLANSWLPSTDEFPAYILETLDEISMSPDNVALVVRGQVLTIACMTVIPVWGGRVSLYWDIQRSISAGRDKYDNTSSSEDTFWNQIYRTLKLEITNVKKSDSGRYRCVWKDLSNGLIRSETTDVWVLEPDETTEGEIKRVNLNQAAFLSCNATWYTGPDYVWAKIGDSENTKPVTPNSTVWFTNQYKDGGYLFFHNVSRHDNGTYECRAGSINGSVIDRKYLTVIEVPEVKIIFAKALGAKSVYLNWTIIYDGNDPINVYHIQRMKNRTGKWEDCLLEISGEKSSYVAEGLEKSTAYRFRLYASNSIDRSLPAESKMIQTLEKDPEFVPTISINETSNNAIRITWSAPPAKYRDLVHYYKIGVSHGGSENVSTIPVTDSHHHTLTNLTTGMEYSIKVGVCSNYTEECNHWSAPKEAFALERDLEVITSTDSKLHSTETSLWIVVGILVILFIVMAIWVAIWMKIRKRSELAARRRFIEATIEVFKSGDRCSVDPALDMAAQAELLPYDKKWEFPRNLLKLGKTLGSGAFGTVKKAEAESICKGQKYSTVAVKMVRVTHRLDHMTALIRELKILAHLGKHINVVNMLGACTHRISYGELLVIVDYCRFGNLHDYLLRRRADFVDQVDVATGNIGGPSFRTDCVLAIDSGINTVDLDDNPATEECSQSTSLNGTSEIVDDPASGDDRVKPVLPYNYDGDFIDSDLEPIGTRDLLCWAWQVSRGMKYLSSKKVVHADLAARNILLADNNTVKICDFGLAKSLYASDIYKKKGNGPLPVKWMAIESIGDRVFSVKSDVWSFGVVLWEFFALAKTPYPGIPNESIYTKLVDGLRMERPKYATEQIYQVMLSCWEAEPSNRPSFTELEHILDELLDARIKDHYLSFDAVYAEINAEELANGKKDYLTMSPSEYASGTHETTV